jgi:uncharacterized protein (DUF58 family)
MTALPSLTRRGQVVLLVAVLGFAMGHLFGGRNLNAVVVPTLALLATTGGYVATLRDPTDETETPRYGHQGDRRQVQHRVLSGTRSVPVRVVDYLDDGLRGDATLQTTTGDDWTGYDVTLRERGVHTIGPTTIQLLDPLGLWARTVHTTTSTRVTVYPRVHPLGNTVGLLQGYVGLTADREHFDGVREYRPGDPLRDVNWKASAKRPGSLAVTEYAGTGSGDHVTVAAESIGPRADAVAEATASVVTYLLDSGLTVEVVTEAGHIPAGSGDPHRRRVLESLARLGRGKLRRRHVDRADIHIVAPESGDHVEVTVGADRQRYAELLDVDRGVVA